MFQRILLCYHGSAASRMALRVCAELAKLTTAEVNVLTIAPLPVVEAAVTVSSVGEVSLFHGELQFRRALKEAETYLRGEEVFAKGYLTRGRPLDQIVEVARALSIDLVVLGRYPTGAEPAWWSLGSRRSRFERMPCHVLIALNGREENWNAKDGMPALKLDPRV